MNDLQAAPLVLRPASPDDDPFLFRLFADDRVEDLKATGLAAAQTEALVAMQYRGRAMSYAAAFPVAQSWIAEYAQNPVARLLEDEQAATLHIVDIAVAEAHRRQGIGRAIVELLQVRAKDLGKGVSAQILVDNLPSRALFAAVGFVERAYPGEARLDVIWRV
jgi:ribosomal protein S18 acetylase RimI-like enzyme